MRTPLTTTTELTNRSSRPPHRDPVIEAVTLLSVLIGILLGTVSGSIVLGLVATSMLLLGFLPMYLI